MRRISPRVALWLLLPALLLSVGACGKPAAEKREIRISVLNRSEVRIYALSVEYYEDGTAIGGTEISRDPERSKPFSAGERLSVPIPEKGLPEDRGNFCLGIRVSVVLKDGSEVPLGSEWSWDAAFGGVYGFTLTGSPSEGFHLKANFDCSVRAL